MTICSHGVEAAGCLECSRQVIDLTQGIEVPDSFVDAPARDGSSTWMWYRTGRGRYSGPPRWRHRGRSVSYHYRYENPDGSEATALEFLASHDHCGPRRPDAPIAILDHVSYRYGFRHTPKRNARCRVKGKNRSRRGERRRGRQEVHGLLREIG